MAKIEIEVDDISLFADALNNACISYSDVVWGIFIGCEIPSKLEPLKKIPYEDLEKRMKCLKDVYGQVIEIEKKQKNI